jgi:hypothetical protein
MLSNIVQGTDKIPIASRKTTTPNLRRASYERDKLLFRIEIIDCHYMRLSILVKDPEALHS